MNHAVKRVAAVHDLSCFGRCSLTVIMPILSCMGIQVCPLPTAVLSTHFGGFSNIAACDFTDHIGAFSQHWKQEKIDFDCIYSGFLASEQQIDMVSAFIDNFSASGTLVLIDPVMGDSGKLYSPYNQTMQEHMKRLICKADVITPNYTEACFLLKRQYLTPLAATENIRKWLVELAELGPSTVVITGIPLAGNQLMNAGYDSKKGCFWKSISERIPACYPGTGDVFASVLVGMLLKSCDLRVAMEQAAHFVELGVKATYAAQTPQREGILLETVLPGLFQDGIG